jgi:ABC-type Na+ efflux pump permease subunit
MALAYILGFLMYMLVFIFGAQVMRGVIEEKTSRVVEVIISSVKPIQLMMGKIIGIALVGLTQFLIWIFLTVAIVTVLKTTILHKTIYYRNITINASEFNVRKSINRLACEFKNRLRKCHRSLPNSPKCSTVQ